MPNPFEPRTRTKVANESVSELDAFVARLRRLGADEQAVSDVRSHWDDFDDDWTPEIRSEIVRKTDPELRRMLVAVDDEFDASTLTTEEVEQTASEKAYASARAAAPDHMGDTIPNILAWVDEDPVRADVVLSLESSPEGAGRKTLVERLEAILAEQAAPETETEEADGSVG